MILRPTPYFPVGLGSSAWDGEMVDDAVEHAAKAAPVKMDLRRSMAEVV